MTNQPLARPPVVKIMEGPFQGFEGVVTGIDQAKNLVQVTFSFFGKKQITTTLNVTKVRRVDPLRSASPGSK